MNWEEERRAILHGNRVGTFTPWELAYGETVLTACQGAMLAPYLAPGLLDGSTTTTSIFLGTWAGRSWKPRSPTKAARRSCMAR